MWVKNEPFLINFFLVLDYRLFKDGMGGFSKNIKFILGVDLTKKLNPHMG
jgi:hypothetical protein